MSRSTPLPNRTAYFPLHVSRDIEETVAWIRPQHYKTDEHHRPTYYEACWNHPDEPPTNSPHWTHYRPYYTTTFRSYSHSHNNNNNSSSSSSYHHYRTLTSSPEQNLEPTLPPSPPSSATDENKDLRRNVAKRSVPLPLTSIQDHGLTEQILLAVAHETHSSRLKLEDEVDDNDEEEEITDILLESPPVTMQLDKRSNTCRRSSPLPSRLRPLLPELKIINHRDLGRALDGIPTPPITQESLASHWQTRRVSTDRASSPSPSSVSTLSSPSSPKNVAKRSGQPLPPRRASIPSATYDETCLTASSSSAQPPAQPETTFNSLTHDHFEPMVKQEPDFLTELINKLDDCRSNRNPFFTDTSSSTIPIVNNQLSPRLLVHHTHSLPLPDGLQIAPPTPPESHDLSPMERMGFPYTTKKRWAVRTGGLPALANAGSSGATPESPPQIVSAEPGTKLVSTDAATDPATDSVTDASTDPTTDLVTDAVTEPATDAVTEPATDAANELATDAAIELATDAATEPATDAAAAATAATELATDAVTDMATDPVTDADQRDGSPKPIKSRKWREVISLAHGGNGLGELGEGRRRRVQGAPAGSTVGGAATTRSSRNGAKEQVVSRAAATSDAFKRRARKKIVVGSKASKKRNTRGDRDRDSSSDGSDPQGDHVDVSQGGTKRKTDEPNEPRKKPLLATNLSSPDSVLFKQEHDPASGEFQGDHTTNIDDWDASDLSSLDDTASFGDGSDTPTSFTRPFRLPASSLLPAIVTGSYYTNEQIHVLYGGGLQKTYGLRTIYHPETCDPSTVLGRIKIRIDHNRLAPRILFGGGRDTDTMRENVGRSVPMFVWRAANQWEYVGHYACERVELLAGGKLPYSEQELIKMGKGAREMVTARTGWARFWMTKVKMEEVL